MQLGFLQEGGAVNPPEGIQRTCPWRLGLYSCFTGSKQPSEQERQALSIIKTAQPAKLNSRYLALATMTKRTKCLHSLAAIAVS